MPDKKLKAKNLIPPELLSMIEQKMPALAAKVKDYLDNSGCFHEVYVREVTIGYLGQAEEDLKHKVGVFGYIPKSPYTIAVLKSEAIFNMAEDIFLVTFSPGKADPHLYWRILLSLIPASSANLLTLR